MLQGKSGNKPNTLKTLHKIGQGGGHPATLPSVKSLTLSAILLAASVATAQSPPDTIFLHGSILTGTHLRSGDTSETPAKVSARPNSGQPSAPETTPNRYARTFAMRTLDLVTTSLAGIGTSYALRRARTSA